MGIEADIAVIGAGPSGLIAAREASRMGASVIVLEEHGEIGLPCHCAGLLSITGLNRIGVPESGPYLLNKIRGAHLISPSNISITVEWSRPIACVVDRHTLDLFLAEEARRGGSMIRLKSKVTWVSRGERGWLLKTSDGDIIEARIIIDAEGARPRIPGMIGLRAHDPERLLKGVQADVFAPGADVDPEHVEVHFGGKLAPGLFAWVIPLRDEAMRIGLACTATDAGRRLARFIRRRFGPTYDRLKFLRRSSGLVVTCGPIERTYGDGILVVGDAAGQTKPITGGGVIFGGICAGIAGKVASKAIASGNLSGEFLRAYEREWKARIGWEIKVALALRRILNSLSDRDLDKLFSMAVREGISSRLASLRDADMDYPAATLLRAMGWRTIKFAPIFFWALLRSAIGFERQVYKWGTPSSTN